MIKLLKVILLFSSLFSRDKSLFGSIENQNGNPLSSVNIVSIPSNIGTQTNDQGYFSFNINPKDTLIICSHVGYEIDTLKVKSFTNGITIVLEDKILAMDSLQVSANTRGEFQRFNAKNNVSEINMDDLSLRGYTDIGDALFNEETILLTESAYGQKSVSARASSKEEMVYLLDGVPINELGDPNVDISLYSSLGLSAIELVKGGHQKALSSSGTINFIPKISYFNSITYSQQFGTYNYGGYNIYGSLGNKYISINAGLNEGRSSQLYSGASAPEILTTKNQNFSNIAFKNRKNLEIRFMAQQNSKIFNNMRTKDSININIENYIMKLAHNYSTGRAFKAYGIYQAYDGRDLIGSTLFEKQDNNIGYGFELLTPIKNGRLMFINQSSYSNADWNLNSEPFQVNRVNSTITGVFESFQPKTNKQFQLKDLKVVYSNQKVIDEPNGKYFDSSFVNIATNAWDLRSTFFSASMLNQHSQNIIMIYMNIGNTFRVPSLSEIGFNYNPSYYISNTPLNPEQKNTFELGVKIEDKKKKLEKRYNLTISWFRYNYVDKIKNIYFSGAPAYFPINIGDASLSGFDSNVSYKTSIDWISFSQSISYYNINDPTAFPLQPDRLVRNKIQLKTKLCSIDFIYKSEGKRQITTINNDRSLNQNYLEPIDNFDINIYREFDINRFEGVITIAGKNLNNVSQKLDGISIYDRRFTIQFLLGYK